MYLLNYERNMEAYMRYDTIDRSNNRILLGIGSSQKQLISKNGGKKEKIIVTVATTIKSMRFRL